MLSSQKLKQIGISEYGVIPTDKIVFGQEVRRLCEQNTCGFYGTTWACPPAVGTLESCKEKCLSFQNALVFNTWYALEDSLDWEGMMEGHKKFKNVCDRLYNLAKEEFPSIFMLSNEGCHHCGQCTYPDAPCRFPHLLAPPIESYGIYVNELAHAANIKYNNGENTVTYFGMLLFSGADIENVIRSLQ